MTLRSCPDCGTAVSLSSAFCKCCGCRIANVLVSCSACSSLIPTHSTTCPQCAAVLQDDTPLVEPTLITASETEAMQTPAMPLRDARQRHAYAQQNKQWRMAAALLLLTIVASVSTFAFRAYHHELAERELFATIMKARVLEGCKNFLEQYPHSYRSAEVRALITTLQEEAKAWAKAQKADNISAYRAFIEQYPLAHQAAVGQLAIDSIAWYTGDFQMQRHTLEHYIKTASNAHYKQKAKDVLSRYATDGVSATETQELGAALEEFFKAFNGKALARYPLRYMHVPLARFFGVSDAELPYVHEYIKRMKKERTTLVYKSLSSVRKERVGGGFCYVAQCVVDRTTNGYHRPYTTYVRLTPHYKVMAIGFMHAADEAPAIPADEPTAASAVPTFHTE